MKNRIERGTRLARTGRAVVLPRDACPRCGATMAASRDGLTLPVNGEMVLVPEADHSKCPKCGEAVLRLDEARRLREAAFDIYRHRHGLLAPGEIRSLREGLGLTPLGLARLLRLDRGTIARWEAGRSVQTPAMDILLRIVRDWPGSLDYLRLRRQAA